MNLNDSILDKLREGDDYAKNDLLVMAILEYSDGITMIPDPKIQSNLAIHLFVARGDCNFYLRKYENSISDYNEALKCKGGGCNSYIFLGLGKSYYELGDKKQAIEALGMAYELSGVSIFEDEDQKYLKIIEDHISDKIPDEIITHNFNRDKEELNDNTKDIRDNLNNSWLPPDWNKN